MSQARLFLIDAQGLCYRAFYAVRGLTDSKGRPTNAVFGVCNILRKLLSDLKPTHIAACFDVGKKTHRQERYAEYKAQRQAMPDDLRLQMNIIHEIIEAYNIPIFELAGYEADDVMATLSLKFAGKDTDVVIVTEDKDMGQLVSEHVKVYSARLEKELKAADIQAKFGVAPHQIVDYIALAGDASDNIPGVTGIGEVGASKLLSEFGSLNGIYEHLEQVKGDKLREKLRLDRSMAFLSQELATLDTNVPLTVKLDDLVMRPSNNPRLVELFEDLEFRKFAQEISGPITQDQIPFKTSVVINWGGQEIHVVYDLKLLKEQGQEFEGQVFDVFLAGYLLSGGRNNYDIVSLAWEYTKQKPHEKILTDLYAPMVQALDAQGLTYLFNQIEQPLCDVLFRMKKNGVQLDVPLLKGLSKECDVKIEHIQRVLFETAGSEFNINSPKQLSEVLFERLKLPVIKKTKTGFSTDEEVLTRLASKHPLPALVLEYRQIAKLKSTYIDALPQLVDVKTSRIHATFNQTGAETGRLSSHNPNLQNIPIRTDFGRRIRGAFVAYQDGHVLLSADYSQIELRILAHLSKDEHLIKAFAKDEDIHRYTASLMFDVPEEQVDEQMRYAAKRINFGIVYGMSAFGLSKDLDIPPSQAQDFIDKYFLRYPMVQAFLDSEIKKARDTGFVTTMFNRRRYLPDINNRNMNLRQFAERQAINAPIQGTAADLIKAAMVNIDLKMTQLRLDSKMILTVHDELVFDVPNHEIDAMALLARKTMESVMVLDVPIKVMLKVGRNWLDMKQI